MSDQFDRRKKEFLSFQKLRKERSGLLSEEERLRRQGLRTKDSTVDCKGCKQPSLNSEWKKHLYVCPRCGYHMPINAKRRLRLLLDEGSFTELYSQVETTNPLDFPGYEDVLEKNREKRDMADALYGGIGSIEGNESVVAVLDSTFMMGSMGEAVGEKLTCLIEEAIARRLPLIVFAASGGARMQEGLFSLFQMAKTSGAIGMLSAEGLLYVSVLTHPTTGGVSASFATLGDIILAEPGALIGFAGPRVIQQTIGQKLPEGFQRSEFQMEHGFVDRIVERKNLRKELGQILRLHTNHGKEQVV